MKNFGIVLLFNITLCSTCVSVYAQTGEITAIQAQLQIHKKELYYPNSVERFYKRAGYKLVWIAPDTTKTHAWDAMLLLDCVVQYGLSHAGYHPKELLYDQLHLLMSQPENEGAGQKVWYDILLTDAMLTFINNLHYGCLNPEWVPGRIDKSRLYGFNAEAVLLKALSDKNFKGTVISVQPQDKAYSSLQYQMHLATGLRTGDCYITPESEIRLMAVNMERLRWMGKKEKTYIQVNIPSQMLTFHNNGKNYNFKIVQGSNQVPFSGNREINLFKIAGGKIYFSVLNSSLSKDAPVKELPILNNQVVNNGMVVSGQAKLLRLLLSNNEGESIVSGNKKDVNVLPDKGVTLKKAIPVHVTYYTCEMKNGLLVKYKDVYSMDRRLENALYKLK